jgi:RsiW-degrading membrane proteinase PrsW (M82 family)
MSTEGRAMSEVERCCICGEPVASPGWAVGGRAYCERHFAALNRPHPGFWRAGAVQIAGMALFTAIVAAIASRLGPLDRRALVPVGIFLALAPSALWIAYFYRQDRLEPEPKTKIAAVFLLAALLTEGVGRRVVDDWFAIDRWASDSRTAPIASVLVAGIVLQAITYLAVRAVVYATPEFDERMDGIVYGTVAGLGVATLLNLRYVLDNDGVALTQGVIQVATVALAQASCGGILGYFMAGARFERRPIWWVPLGLALAAALNGLLQWLLREVGITGLTVQPWRQLVLGLAVALAVFAALVALMRRSTTVTLARRAG